MSSLFTTDPAMEFVKDRRRKNRVKRLMNRIKSRRKRIQIYKSDEWTKIGK